MRFEIGDKVRWEQSLFYNGVYEIDKRYRGDDGWRYDIKGNYSDGYSIRENDLELVASGGTWDKEAI